MSEPGQDEPRAEETRVEDADGESTHADEPRRGAPDLAEIGRIGMELMADIGNAVTAERDTGHYARPRDGKGQFRKKQEPPEIGEKMPATRKKLSSTWLKRLLPKNGGLIDAYNALSQTLMKLDERMQRNHEAGAFADAMMERDEDLDRRITDELDRIAAAKAAYERHCGDRPEQA